MTRRKKRFDRPTITYHSHIYDLAMSASGEAMALGLALSWYVAYSRSSIEKGEMNYSKNWKVYAIGPQL